MTGKKWTTGEQDGFLDEYNAQYLAAQTDGNYRKFWPLVHEAWFNKYPEIETVFPDKSAADLTEVEKDSLKNAIQKRQSVSLNPVPVISLMLSNCYSIMLAT
jgi:hypothetical protein